MQQLNLRNRRLLGIGFILFALVLDLFFWLVAGPRSLVVGSSSSILLIIFGGLFLSGRWPPVRREKKVNNPETDLSQGSR